MLMNKIKIDPERIVSDIDRNIFGGYIEHGAGDNTFEYLDLGDSPHADKNNLRKDVMAVLDRMNLPNIRFPGGNFVSGYRWMDGIGPRQERPARWSAARHCVIENTYGTNEFMRFCRATGIEPYFCVNCGDGDMREAADWVEYCNGTGDTALVKLRRTHGFAEPHNIKYWGIGNEVDSPGQIGMKTAQEYAREYTEFSKVMKRTDPNIKLVASAICSWEDHPLGPEFLYRPTEWVERAQLMLEQAGDRIDYMAIHRYADMAPEDTYETYMAFGADFDDRITAYEGIIRAVSLERGIKHQVAIAVDEWAAAHRPKPPRRDTPVRIARDEYGVMRIPAEEAAMSHRPGGMTINLEDALVTAQYLNIFIRHAYSVRMANLTPMPTFIRKNIANPDCSVPLQAIYYPFELYSRTCGQLALDVFWSGDTFSGTYKNRAYNGIRTLDVSATLDQARKQLVVYVINLSKDKAMETTIDLTSGELAGNVKVSVINGPDTKAENTLEKPNQVKVQDAIIKAAGKSFTYSFEPHSVTALVCAVR